MSHVRVQALGGFNVASGGGREVPIAGSCRPILAYLLTHRHRPVSKLELAETLWADRDGTHARHCLATALWRIKKTIAAHTPLLTFHGAEEISFNWSAPMWVDSIALEQRLAPLIRRKAETLTHDELSRIERGVRLYRGDYLIGMEHEWAWLERQRLRDLYCDGLYQLVMAYATGSQWEHVLKWGRQLCREEPLREDVHRWLMLASLHTGNRASAIAQYRQCQRALAADLGVEPMAETQAIYQQLVRTGSPAPAVSTLSAASPSLDHVRRRVGRVRRLLVVCQRQLDAAADLLGDLPDDSPETRH
ncbi:MAG TPA: BTAD domain-containing putative transcriptional regulator [Lysobacter sp.]|jgi:DNA-binding SARP family transcriptional activator|nr:BTAD domain-containing putative transcriptional regulator [Lysobacter sp.]